MNLGMFTGRIGKDAETRSLNNGEKVSNFPLACNVGTKENEKTMWVDCSLWGKRAESLAPHLLKGSKITVHGRLNLDEFQKKDGSQGYRLNLAIDHVDLHSKPDGAKPAAAPAAGAAPGISDDDIPF